MWRSGLFAVRRKRGVSVIGHSQTTGSGSNHLLLLLLLLQLQSLPCSSNCLLLVLGLISWLLLPPRASADRSLGRLNEDERCLSDAAFSQVARSDDGPAPRTISEDQPTHFYVHPCIPTTGGRATSGWGHQEGTMMSSRGPHAYLLRHRFRHSISRHHCNPLWCPR